MVKCIKINRQEKKMNVVFGELQGCSGLQMAPEGYKSCFHLSWTCSCANKGPKLTENMVLDIKEL